MSDSPDAVQQLLTSSNLGDRLSGLNRLRDVDPALAFNLIQPLLVDPNPRVRYAAVSQLDVLGEQDRALAWELLRDRLRNDDEIDVKAAAADAIGGLKLGDALEELVQVYHQTEEWVLQLSVIATLGELGNPEGTALLREALKNPNELILAAAIGSLGELGDRETVAWIAPFARHEDWQVRYRLAQALGNLGGDEARTVLEELARDDMEQVADAARQQLQIAP